MDHAPLSQDPVDEATNSAVFVPLDASLVRKLAGAHQTFHDDDAFFSEPSDDESERRYSDVSADAVQEETRCPSPDTVELIRQWNLRVRDSDLQQDSPPAMQDRAREPSTIRSFGQPTSSSSNGLSPSVSRRWEETLPSGARLFEERKRSVHASGPALEPKRYEFYGVGMENNPAYYSTPHFSLRSSKPEAIPPIARPEPHKKKLSSFWKFLSGKRRPKRERRTEEVAHRESFQGATEPVREKRDWRVDSFRRLRRSGRHPTNLEALTPHNQPTSKRRQSASMDQRAEGGTRTLVRSPESGITGDQQHLSPVTMMNNDSPSLGFLPGSTLYGNGERLGSCFDSKREASSFAAYRGRVMFMTEGSSVSSLSDREDENNVESSHLYLSRRQLRAMQYK